MRIIIVLVLISIVCAASNMAQVIPQPSILSFVHRAGNTTAEQDSYTEAWSLWWGNADLLLKSMSNVLAREAQREADFRRSGYTNVSDNTTVVRRHQYKVDQLLDLSGSQECPSPFSSSYDSIRQALESLKKAVNAETSYLMTGSTTDRTNLQRYQEDVAEHLAESRDLFWEAIKSTKPDNTSKK